MQEKVFILDSLEKIEQFSNGTPPYQTVQGVSTIPNLLVNGSPVLISELFRRVKDRTITDYDGKVAQFETQSQAKPSKPLSDDLNRNLGYLGYPCLKANFVIFGKEQVSKYPVIRIFAAINDNGLITQLVGDFEINQSRDPSDTDPTKLFVPFEVTEPLDTYESPSELKDILDIATPDYTDPNCAPKKISKFYANDQSWGIVPLGTKVVKSVLLENRGETTLVINDFKPISNDYFRILTLQRGIEIEPGRSISFDVEYSPLEDAETTHTLTVLYDVLEGGDPTKPVDIEKTISVLIGTGDVRDLIDDVTDDLGDGVLTDDDNGVFVTKKISKIVDKSIPLEKWRTKGLWECVGERMYQFFTGSNGTINDAHYLSIYNKEFGTVESYHQFDISYGHKNGLGSRLITDGMDIKPARTMYRKYLIECYEPEANTNKERPTKFKFKNEVNGDYAYFIQVNRDQFKDMLDPGNFELCLSPLSSSSNQLVNTGSNVQMSQTNPTIYTLIDESWDAKQNQTDGRNLKEWYYVVSGSKRDGVYSEETDNAWGVVFPKLGLIVLDGVVLDQSCSFNTVTASIDGQNTHKLFLSISGSSSTTGVRTTSGSFFARSAERVITETYFCRARQNEFNYSTNPTYVSGSDNDFRYDYFVTNPHSYITSIGLYNKKGTLLAVGKLKRPILKNDNKSYVFQVRVRLN